MVSITPHRSKLPQDAQKGQTSHPPPPARRDAPCPKQGRSENPLIPYTSLKGSGRGCPLLRASSDHCFIVGALRARRAPGRSPLPFFSILLDRGCDVRLRDRPTLDPVSANIRLRFFHEGDEQVGGDGQ